MCSWPYAASVWRESGAYPSERATSPSVGSASSSLLLLLAAAVFGAAVTSKSVRGAPSVPSARLPLAAVAATASTASTAAAAAPFDASDDTECFRLPRSAAMATWWRDAVIAVWRATNVATAIRTSASVRERGSRLANRRQTCTSASSSAKSAPAGARPLPPSADSPSYSSSWRSILHPPSRPRSACLAAERALESDCWKLLASYLEVAFRPTCVQVLRELLHNKQGAETFSFPCTTSNLRDIILKRRETVLF